MDLGLGLKLRSRGASAGGGGGLAQLTFVTTSSTTQSTSTGSDQEISFQTEEIDNQGAFASNRFTVPVAYNGSYAELFAGIGTTSGSTARCQLTIQRSTDSGSSWEDFATKGGTGWNSFNLSSGPVLLATGDIYRVVIEVSNTPNPTVENIPETFFKGFSL